MATANDIVNMDSFGGVLADYFVPNAQGGRRAGRSTQMARAAGEDPGLLVEHPITTDVLAGIAGSSIGASIGNNFGSNKPVGDLGVNVGTLVGAGIGGLAAAVLARIIRRSQMNDINKAYDKARSKGKLKVVDPELSQTAGLILPLGGPHRAGQVAALRAQLRKGESDPSRTESIGDVARILPIPVISDATSIIGGAVEGVQSANEAERLLSKKAAEAKEEEKKDKKKKAKDDKSTVKNVALGAMAAGDVASAVL
jgi:hypothetical protein